MPTVSSRLPLRLRPVATGMSAGGVAHVDQPPAEPPRALGEQWLGGEAVVHAADDVEPGLQRLDQRRPPVGRNHAAAIGDADHQRPRAARRRLGRGQEGQAGGHGRAGQGIFPDTFVGGPVVQAERGLGVAGVGRIAEEEQVGGGQVERPRFLSVRDVLVQAIVQRITFDKKDPLAPRRQ